MGNNFVCENYYCQPALFKPEWISENNWKINYNYEKNINPYNIDKGIFKINNVNKFEILISKKLFIDINEINNIIIPIKLKYNLLLNNFIEFFIIFSDNLLTIDSILEPNNESIYFDLKNNKLIISRNSDDEKNIIDISSKKENKIEISLENNYNFIVITEKIINYHDKLIFEKKYIKSSNYKKDLFLSIFIKNNNTMEKNEFIEFFID